MHKLIITTALLLFSLSAAADTPREKVLIFNLSIIHEKSVLVDTHKKEERFDYYSLIIPHTIAKHLNVSGKVEAQKIGEELPLKDIGSGEFYERMGALAAGHAAGFLLGGKGTIRGRKLTLELALIDVRKKDFSAIIKETFETGAELKNIIAEVSADIERRLAISIDETRAEKIKKEPAPETGAIETPEAAPVSPFLKMYRALDGLSFGIRTGNFFIKGPFSKIYEDSEYIGPYLRYGILSWLGASIQADYLCADNGEIVVRKNSSMALWGISANADFTWRLFSRFGLRLSVGTGVSIGRIYLWGSENPFGGLNKQEQSIDPYLNCAVSTIIQLMPVEIEFGGSYKSAFFKGKSLSLLAVFFGIGYHL